MAFAGHQAGGRIKADPARAGQKDLAPGMQIGEVFGGTARPVNRFDVGLQLDQVAGDKARCQPEVAQHLHHQPAAVAARARGELQGFFGRLHARLHADGVLNVALQLLVQSHQKVHGAAGPTVHLVQIALEQRRGRRGSEIGCQLARLGRAVLEWKLLGLGLQKKVERVEDGHFDDHIDRDLELARGRGKHQPCLVVGKRVLLPVDEVAGRLDLERIRQHLGTTVGGRPQADYLRPQLDEAVIGIVRDVTQGDVNGQVRLAFFSWFVGPRAAAGSGPSQWFAPLFGARTALETY